MCCPVRVRIEAKRRLAGGVTDIFMDIRHWGLCHRPQILIHGKKIHFPISEGVHNKAGLLIGKAVHPYFMLDSVTICLVCLMLLAFCTVPHNETSDKIII